MYDNFGYRGEDLNGRAVDELAEDLTEPFDGRMVVEVDEMTRGMAVPLESFPENCVGLVEAFGGQVVYVMAELWVC